MTKSVISSDKGCLERVCFKFIFSILQSPSQIFFSPARLQGNLQLPVVVIVAYGFLCLLYFFQITRQIWGISECMGLLRGNNIEETGSLVIHLAHGSYLLVGNQYEQNLSLCPIR